MKKQNQVQEFYSEEFGSLEVLMIDGKPYFPATDCAKILGYSKPHDAVSRHCAHSVKHGVCVAAANQFGTNGKKTVQKIFIPEGDLYRLIIRSKLPAAVRFEAFVCDEILPSIRKHGAYATSDTLKEMLHNPQFAESVFNALIEENNKNATLEKKVGELLPKANYCEHILESDSALPISVIAKDYGVSASLFNRALHDLGIPGTDEWVIGNSTTATTIFNPRRRTLPQSGW